MEVGLAKHVNKQETEFSEETATYPAKYSNY
jgi:hypothetical protein